MGDVIWYRQACHLWMSHPLPGYWNHCLSAEGSKSSKCASDQMVWTGIGKYTVNYIIFCQSLLFLAHLFLTCNNILANMLLHPCSRMKWRTTHSVTFVTCCSNEVQADTHIWISIRLELDHKCTNVLPELEGCGAIHFINMIVTHLQCLYSLKQTI